MTVLAAHLHRLGSVAVKLPVAHHVALAVTVDARHAAACVNVRRHVARAAPIGQPGVGAGRLGFGEAAKGERDASAACMAAATVVLRDIARHRRMRCRRAGCGERRAQVTRRAAASARKEALISRLLFGKAQMARSAQLVHMVFGGRSGRLGESVDGVALVYDGFGSLAERELVDGNDAGRRGHRAALHPRRLDRMTTGLPARGAHLAQIAGDDAHPAVCSLLNARLGVASVTRTAAERFGLVG